MKAIILTYAPVTKEEKKLLRNTNVFKIATNFSAAELKPNIRLCADNIVQKCLDCDTCPVVSCNYDLEKERVINGCHLPQRHSTLLTCIDYLYLKGYEHVLLVASNPDSATCKINYEGIKIYKDCIYLYKYTKYGNLDIPHMTIKEFLMNKLTDEEKLFGLKEPRPKTLLEKTVFTDSVKYEIHTEGSNNHSIETGVLINNILPFEMKQRFLNGENEINYNGLIIKRLTQVTPNKEETPVIEEKEETEEEIKEVKQTVKKKTVKKGKK